MKRRRRVFSSLFLTSITFFAAAVILHWNSHVRAALPMAGQLAHADTAPMPFQGPPLFNRPATLSERKSVTAIIQAQLDAFQKDDFVEAMVYQSETLKPNFPNPEAFRLMIHRHYPEFADFKSVKFGPAQADNKGRLVLIPVLVTGQDGVKVSVLYMMSLENKVYRIQGVESSFVPPHGLPSTSPGLS